MNYQLFLLVDVEFHNQFMFFYDRNVTKKDGWNEIFMVII